MTFAQLVASAAASSELTLNTVIDGFAAIVSLFVLRTVMDSRDKVRAIWTALYGEKDAEPKNGALRKLAAMDQKLSAHTTAFDSHVQGDESWRHEARELAMQRNMELQKQLTKIDTRLESVEDKLPERRRSK